MDELDELGVKDSKKLSDSKRERLREQLDGLGRTFLKEIEASEIDELSQVMNLNEIEVKGFVDVIRRSDADEVFVDLPEPDGDRFIRKLKDQLPVKFKDMKFVAEHGADEEYDIVSAASIVAKSAREEHVEKLQKKYGYDFKSGYPHDKPTREFLKKYLKEKGELPPEARLSWSTSQDLIDESEQSGLGEF